MPNSVITHPKQAMSRTEQFHGMADAGFSAVLPSSDLMLIIPNRLPIKPTAPTSSKSFPMPVEDKDRSRRTARSTPPGTTCNTSLRFICCHKHCLLDPEGSRAVYELQSARLQLPIGPKRRSPAKTKAVHLRLHHDGEVIFLDHGRRFPRYRAENDQVGRFARRLAKGRDFGLAERPAKPQKASRASPLRRAAPGRKRDDRARCEAESRPTRPTDRAIQSHSAVSRAPARAEAAAARAKIFQIASAFAICEESPRRRISSPHFWLRSGSAAP